MDEKKKTLSVNCGFACLLKDRQGMLDAYDQVQINCGCAVVSTELNGKLLAKGGHINAGNFQVRDIKGEIIQLTEETVIGGGADFKDRFVIAEGNLLVCEGGLEALEQAEGGMVQGNLFYPETADISALTRVSVFGKKRAYPPDAQVFLGDRSMENLTAGAEEGKKHLWVSGRVSAFSPKTLENAKARSLRVSCESLFTYEGLEVQYGNLFRCGNRVLVPDGHEITGSIKSAELPLYGTRIYVNGTFTMDEKDLPALEPLESIIVQGKAELPSSAVKTFREKGRADSYFVFEGRLQEINGFEELSHGQLAGMAERGEKLTLLVNGCLLFSKDVTGEDMDCIASLSYNGAVLLPGTVKSALAAKVKVGNGLMADPALLEELTGQSLKEIIKHGIQDTSHASSSINTGRYMLI
jgi:hypothetical protein